MKMDILAGSGNDEFYTPEYAVTPILEYIKPQSKIWCPFDTEESKFVSLLGKQSTVINTHLDMEIDFFDVYYECDYIISNPPYSKKFEVFERLFELNKPFAMLVGVAGLFESQKRYNLFKNNDFEIMYFNKRISYFKNYGDDKPYLNPPFSSVYITKNMLPNRIIFKELIKK